MGKKIRIDLPEGNQVVTTVKHEKIPKPPKKEPPIIWFILAVYISMILIASLRHGGSDFLPEETYLNPEPIPTYPPNSCPYPGTPECY